MWARLILLICAFGLAASPLRLDAPADAQTVRPDWVAPRGQNNAQAENILSIRDIIDRVRRQVGGEFVSMRRLERNSNPPFYELRWRFSNEVVEDIRVDATNGRVMGR